LRVSEQRGKTIALGYFHFCLLQILTRDLALEDTVDDLCTGVSELRLHIRPLTINAAWVLNARSSQQTSLEALM
jgi:hypothetical protein